MGLNHGHYTNFFLFVYLKALVKRSPQASEQHITQALSSNAPGSFGIEQMLPSSLRRRPSSPVNIDTGERGTRDRQRLATLTKQLGMLI